jgi:hypothetical protein
VWDWSIQNGSFNATNETKNYTYSGTATALPTGFTKLLIQSTSDPGVTAGQSAYAIELPNTALLIQPAGADTLPPIMACGLGANPAGPTVTYNFVTVPSSTWSIAQAAAGDVTFNVAGDSYSGNTAQFDITGQSIAGGTASFTCTNGRLSNPNGPNGTVLNGAVTPSGICVIDFGPNNGGIIGVKQAGVNVDTSTLANMTFNGFMVRQGVTECVQASPNGDGTLKGKGYASDGGVETGTFETGASGVSISFGGQLAPGLVKMNVTTSGGSETIMCCVNVVGGKTMLLGFGAGGGSAYNVMMVQQ